jgi:hypothetical protein
VARVSRSQQVRRQTRQHCVQPCVFAFLAFGHASSEYNYWDGSVLAGGLPHRQT